MHATGLVVGNCEGLTPDDASRMVDEREETRRKLFSSLEPSDSEDLEQHEATKNKGLSLCSKRIESGGIDLEHYMKIVNKNGMNSSE